MLISCEKCKKIFEVNERHLTSSGVTAVCPYCDHKHRVKRIVIPYSVNDEEDTEPIDIQELIEKGKKNTTYIKEDDLSDDIEPIEVKSEIVLISRESDEKKETKETKENNKKENQKSYHLSDRRKGSRGTIFDRLVSVNFLYLLLSAIIVLGLLVYLISR